jgi:hypothetical protein
MFASERMARETVGIYQSVLEDRRRDGVRRPVELDELEMAHETRVAVPFN